MTTADPTPEPIVVGLWTFTRDGDFVVVDHPVFANGARYLDRPVFANGTRYLPRSAITALFGEVERLRSKVGPDRDDRPDGALCWDPDGPNGGAWVLRGRDVPDGWRWWRRRGVAPIDRTPGVLSGLYWALPPAVPATERVRLDQVIGRRLPTGEDQPITVVHIYSTGAVWCGGEPVTIHDDGTVTVLVEDGDQ